MMTGSRSDATFPRRRPAERARVAPRAMLEPYRSELNPRQLAVLHVAKARLGLDDETYRDLLESEAGVRSARDLDGAGFAAVMRRLERLGFHARRPAALPERPGMASAAQLDYLRGLWRRYTGRRDERGLDTWLRKQCGAADLAALDRAGAHKALTALKAMVARLEPPRDGTHG
jgi:Bacteriophage Mu, GemA protein